MPKTAILTFCVGADYKKAMEPGLASKREYAKRHGYDFHTDGEDVWDHDKPIPWSKFHFILKYLDQYDYLFWSDADVILLNQDLRLEDHVLPHLPKDKDILWTMDACNHYNNGHLLIRGKSSWVKNYFQRCLQQNDLLYHIWWDNAAMIRLFESNPLDQSKIYTLKEHWIMNSYLFGPKNTAQDKSVRLYRHGDLLLHFAGVYDPYNIHRMMKYVLERYKTKTPLDLALLDAWRVSPPSKVET
jgi:hypothetical protein